MDGRTHRLERIPDQQLMQYFRWYWMIEARIFASLCRLKGCEPALGLHRRMPDYSHRAYVSRFNEFCDKLAPTDGSKEAHDLLRKRHEALLEMVDAATRYLGDQAWEILGFAGVSVGQDMGRELRLQADSSGQPPPLPEDQAEALVPPMEVGAPAAHCRLRSEFALREARERDIVGTSTAELDHVIRRFHEGFLAGYRGIEAGSRVHPDEEPSRFRRGPGEIRVLP